MYKQVVKLPEGTVNVRPMQWESQDGGYPDEIHTECKNGRRIRYIRCWPGSIRGWIQSYTTKGFFLLGMASFWLGVVIQVIFSLIQAGTD